jgi:formylglycine-generating enzyme required for sulfatase activity
MIRAAVIVCGLCAAAFAQRPEFVRIPPGGFAMAKTETTVAQFAAFVKALGYQTAAEQAGDPRTWRAPGYKVAGNQPIVYVTVKDATAYCEWISARLPTDAEWVRAARAESTTRHYWGDRIDGRYLWYRANTRGRPGPVGKKLPNSWGLFDVEGNVWEWTISPPQEGAEMANRRGGSWIDCEDIEGPPGQPPGPLIGLSKYYKIAVRLDHRYDDIGFRCARTEPRAQASGF